MLCLRILAAAAAVVLLAQPAMGQSPRGDAGSRLLTVEGKVEVAAGGSGQWKPGMVSQILAAGDRVRTGARSRATIRLSNQSVLRVNELTTLEIRPSQMGGAAGSFELRSGATYFFNRERPADVQFRTPLASGAIRGTEFGLTVAADGKTELSLLDGQVDLANGLGQIALVAGEQGVVEPNLPPRKTAVLDSMAVVQWALYYPAVLDPDEPGLADAEKNALAASLTAYRAGDLPGALAAYPENREPGSDAEKVYRAATLLAAGQVPEAVRLLENNPSAAAGALRELIAVVTQKPAAQSAPPALASDWLARSYRLQAESKLSAALDAARRAASKSPGFAATWIRVAELEFNFGNLDAAERALDKGLALSPRHAQGMALRGFILAGQNQFTKALQSFDDAIAADPALGNAWLGRGLVKIHRRQTTEGRQDLQTAATLEPRRAVTRSYLGKAWSQVHNPQLAEKEFNLAKKLDPNDPTAWLYAAILEQQGNRVNEAVRDLEKSQALNDNRSLFRSRLLLDQDKAVRSANLARIYQDAGMNDWALREAGRAVSYDYANYSAHQFLAQSYDALRDPRQINLRYEAPAVSEYFIANLLSPVGATPLSTTLSQQEYTRLFDHDRIGIASSTEYFSGGDWIQRASQYGVLGTSEWSLDADYLTQNGERRNNDIEKLQLAARIKQQITPHDTIYLEAQRNEFESGDVVQYYDQKSADPQFRLKETQEPNLFLGWHHEWAPGHHTLALLGRMDDQFGYRTPNVSAYELNHDATGNLSSVRRRAFGIHYDDDIEGYTAELQQIATVRSHTFVFGGRFQVADTHSEDLMRLRGGSFPGTNVYRVSDGDHRSTRDIQRESGYIYDFWQVTRPLQLTVGVTYDHLSFPGNHDASPLDDSSGDRSQVSPKAGFIWNPRDDTAFRFAYTRSLGGVFFDNSYRLEPTAVAGFNQAFRSIAPESVTNAGVTYGTRMETFGLGLDRKLGSNTYFSVVGEMLNSRGTRSVGVFHRYSGQVIAESGSVPQEIDYSEKSLTVSLDRLVGNNLAVGARYRLTDGEMVSRFTTIPTRLLGSARYDAEAILHQIELHGTVQLPCGFFSQLEAVWTAQNNRGADAGLADESFWQLNAFVGHRFWQRHAEARVGVLNITDEDYKLNPLTLYSEMPRERTFYASFKFYF